MDENENGEYDAKKAGLYILPSVIFLSAITWSKIPCVQRPLYLLGYAPARRFTSDRRVTIPEISCALALLLVARYLSRSDFLNTLDLPTL